MKNILIYINDSLGELDWIAPFIKSKEAEGFNFYIFLNGPGNNHAEKRAILKEYDLLRENVKQINSLSKKDFYLFKVDEFLNRVLGRIKLLSLKLFKFFRKIIDGFRWLVSYLFIDSSIKFDYVFRDYNLKESFSLQQYLHANKKAKIVVFPHAVGLQKIHPSCPREKVKIVKADLWLENSGLSDIVKNTLAYREVFFASGAPAFDVNYKETSLFDVKAKKVLIITRDCGMTFGFNYEEAFLVFNKLLEQLEIMGYDVEVKHHPRDRKLDEWRKIQKKYNNISELNKSLNDIDLKYSACLTLFSTAPLFLLSRQIPIFEFSPYKKYAEYKSELPMHYADENALLTHDLLALELYSRVDDVNKLSNVMNRESLEYLSTFQYRRCQEVFPKGANLNIVNKLVEIFDER